MRNKKKSLFKELERKCTKKVKICTMRFCAEGCLSENFDDEDIVCLDNVEITYTSGNCETQHRASLCICDDHIIAFEAIKE